MRAVDARVEPLLDNLSKDSRIPRGAEDVIRQSIVESPYLNALLGNAAEKRQIGAIKVSHGEHNGGHYEAGEDGQPGTVYISATNFTEWTGTARLGLVTEVLGHEGMHGVLTPYRDGALSEFTQAYGAAMTQAYRNFDERVDVTAEVRTYLDWGRKEEAMAEISGLRALNSRNKNFSPDASDAELEQLLAQGSTSRCIDRSGPAPRLAAGISYEDLTTLPHKDGTRLTPAVERCFYDGAATLGRNGDSDYRNYYGTSPVSSIAQGYEALWRGRPPAEIRVDLRELGLDPRQLERNGLDLGKAKVFPIIDLGKDGYGRIELNNTSSLIRVQGEKADRVVDGANRSPRLLSTGDQALLDQIRGKVEILDRASGRAFDETSERLSPSLLAAAKDAGITRADHVVLSKQTDNLPAAQNIFVVQGELANPAAIRTGATMQQLAPPTEGNAGESRAITHYQTGADGVARPVATTTTEELRAAWQDVRALAAQPIQQPGPQQADPLQPGGADYALHQQIRAGVAALDAQHGRAPDAVSDRMTASLLVLAKENDLSRVDQVALSAATGHQPAGHTVFLIKGDLSSPPFALATMTTDRAVATPVEVSMQRYQQMNQEAQQQSAARQVEQQAQDGRVQGVGRE